jgi:c-di-GMP-binding flagellar brake protein YcgR
MDAYDIKIGIKLELELVNSLGERIGQPYVSQLIDVSDKNRILIAAPIHEARLMLITNGTKVRIIFLHHTQGLLSFEGIISKKEKRENLFLFGIDIQTEFEKIQRRKYFRLECILNAQYRTVDPLSQDTPTDSSEAPKPPDYKKAYTRNLSGNGAGVAIGDELKKNTLMEIEITISKDVVIKMEGKVIRCTELPNQRERKFECGLYFTKISQRDQDILIKFIFDQQRKILKNTLVDR